MIARTSRHGAAEPFEAVCFEERKNPVDEILKQRANAVTYMLTNIQVGIKNHDEFEPATRACLVVMEKRLNAMRELTYEQVSEMS
jgi:hypothetical protein